jgi:hypothetical protein
MALRQPGNATQLSPGKEKINKIVGMFEQIGKAPQDERAVSPEENQTQAGPSKSSLSKSEEIREPESNQVNGSPINPS